MKFGKKSLDHLVRIAPHFDRSAFLRLDMNENPAGIDKDFFDRCVKKLSPALLSTYPNPDPLAKKLAAMHGVDTSNILITNGSDAAIKYTFEALCEPQDGVLLPTPTFAMYDVYCDMYALNKVKIPYNEDLTFPFKNFYNSIQDGVRIVVTLNPNNPIGTVFSDEEMTAIIERAEQVGAFVMIDEAYHYFYPKTFETFVKKYPNVLLYRTFSKLCSLAGCRLGYVIADSRTIEAINKVRPTFDANSLALFFAEQILDADLIPKLIMEERQGRQRLAELLKEHAIPYSMDFGNYLFIACGKYTKLIEHKLFDNKVLVKTFDQDGLKQYIRVSTGNKELMEHFFKIFLPIYKETVCE